MEPRVPTIWEMAEEAERRQKKAQPQTGTRKLKPVRKASARTSRRPARRKSRRAGKKKRG